MTFYLKYRPQQIADLDSDRVREQLSLLLGNATIPHAFLFSGPRGLGKTSSARILAKALNCLGNDFAQDPVPKVIRSFEPCNSCLHCQSITKGSAVDVIEIDGASNRGIDDVRALRETILSLPVQMRKKVYVIDEVHMLTKEAFNALLKTLEEPPPHVVFILATTEPSKVPETIASRAFHIQFQQANHDEIKRALQRVIVGEHLVVDDAVIEVLIERAKGGFRDSHKLLEQLALTTTTLDKASLELVFPDTNVQQWLEMMGQYHAQEALQWVEDQSKKGANWEEILAQMLQMLKAHLLSLSGLPNESSLTLSLSQTRLLMKLGLEWGAKLKSSLISEIPIILLVTEFCQNASQEVEKEPLGSSVSQQSTIKTIKKKLTIQQKNVAPAKKELIGNSITVTIENIRSQWDNFLGALRPMNHSLSAILSNANPEKIEDDRLVISVYYEFHKERLEMANALRVVEEVCARMFHPELGVCYHLADKQQKQYLDLQQDSDLAKAAEEIFS